MKHMLLRDDYADMLATCRLLRFKYMVRQLSWHADPKPTMGNIHIREKPS